MTENIIVVISVVIKNFFPILGFFGAPGSIPPSFPLKTSLFDWIPIGNTEKTIDSNDEHTEDQQQILKIVKDITSKGFVRSNYKKKLVDLSDIKINLKGKK